MRFTSWSATALGATAFLNGALVQATYTTTVEVMRAQASWASTATGWHSKHTWPTSNGTAWATGTGTGMGAGTGTGAPSATGASPTWTATSASPVAATGAASPVLGLDKLGLAAIAGLVGLAAL